VQNTWRQKAPSIRLQASKKERHKGSTNYDCSIYRVKSVRHLTFLFVN